MVKLLPYVNIFLLRLTHWTFRLGYKGVRVVGASNLIQATDFEQFLPLPLDFYCHPIQYNEKDASIYF